MRFKIDENLPGEIGDLFREAGHDALSVVDQRMAGVDDPSLGAVCRTEQRAIVTLDLDFSDIRRYSPADFTGIIVLRPVTQTIPSLLRMTQRVIALLGQERLDRCLWIVDDSRVRIRELEQEDETRIATE